LSTCGKFSLGGSSTALQAGHAVGEFAQCSHESTLTNIADFWGQFNGDGPDANATAKAGIGAFFARLRWQLAKKYAGDELVEVVGGSLFGGGVIVAGVGIYEDIKPCL